mmetsp:Transcript_48257/g.120813  ORF Transcript_48257/g.120813 Transcript_48257/m.120813 type:complete len:280 (+) Transcript_48257:296-1135(+)
MTVCFPRDGTVVTPEGAKTMEELREGDMVLSMTSSGSPFFDQVVTFLHRAPHAMPPAWIDIHYRPLSPPSHLTQNGNISNVHDGRLRLSPEHYVYVLLRRRLRATEAQQVQPGDSLIVHVAKTSTWSLASVLRVRPISSSQQNSGLYAPLTFSRRLFVDGVLVSVYSFPVQWPRVLPFPVWLPQLVTWPVRMWHTWTPKALHHWQIDPPAADTARRPTQRDRAEWLLLMGWLREQGLRWLSAIHRLLSRWTYGGAAGERDVSTHPALEIIRLLSHVVFR